MVLFCFKIWNLTKLRNYDATLVRCRRNHEIPNDVLIKRLGPNEVTAIVRRHDNHIPFWILLIHQLGLQFLVSPMLKEVMAHCGLTFMQASINFVRTVLIADTMMRREGLPFFAFDLLNIYTEI